MQRQPAWKQDKSYPGGVDDTLVRKPLSTKHKLASLIATYHLPKATITKVTNSFCSDVIIQIQTFNVLEVASIFHSIEHNKWEKNERTSKMKKFFFVVLPLTWILDHLQAKENIISLPQCHNPYHPVLKNLFEIAIGMISVRAFVFFCLWRSSSYCTWRLPCYYEGTSNLILY